MILFCPVSEAGQTGLRKVDRLVVMARTGRPRSTEPLLSRFLDRVTVGYETGCWEWAAGKFASGYGALYLQETGRNHPAHRVSWELFRGPIPDGLVIDHKCRNRGCVNPQHLEPVTHRVNTVDRSHAPTALAHMVNVCMKGLHSLDDSYVKKDGRRQCRQCHRDSERTRQKNRTTPA